VTEALGVLSVAAVTLGLAVAWLAWTAIRLDTASPDRLVAELRLSQVSALVLVLVAGVYVGAAVANETIPGVGLDIALATGFFVIAALATTSEPSRALMVLAAAWGAHALVDLGHLAEVLPAAAVPSWYPTACAIYDVGMAGVCYLPVFRRT